MQLEFTNPREYHIHESMYKARLHACGESLLPGNVGFQISKEERDWLREFSRQNGLTGSTVLRHALHEYRRAITAAAPIA